MVTIGRRNRRHTEEYGASITYGALQHVHTFGQTKFRGEQARLVPSAFSGEQARLVPSQCFCASWVPILASLLVLVASKLGQVLSKTHVESLSRACHNMSLNQMLTLLLIRKHLYECQYGTRMTQAGSKKVLKSNFFALDNHLKL